MDDNEIKQIIGDTANAVIMQLKAEEFLQSGSRTAYEKTEELLWQYPALKKVQTPYARRVCQEIEACMAEIQNEPYKDVIRLFYFERLTNEAVINSLPFFCGSERTCRRNRKKLVQRFSVRLASDEFIKELLK